MELDLPLVQHLRIHIEPFLQRTPMVRAPWQTNAFLKLECLQHTASFKVRGPLAMRAMYQEPRQWVTASAGNHGLGVAFAARHHWQHPKIFVPQSSAQVKRRKILALGGEVQVVPTTSYDETERTAKEWCHAHGAFFVSPFDDPIIMAGNGGTLGLEILEQLPRVRTLLVPVGGGGLCSGVACTVKSLQSNVRIIGVQGEKTSAMYQSFQQGRAVCNQRTPETLAEGLEGGVSEQSFRYASRWLDDMVLVSEESIAGAMLHVEKHLHLRIEGSAAVVVAYALSRAETLSPPVCMILSGGNVDNSTWRRAMALSAHPR